MVDVMIPRLAGSRERAVVLSAELPADLSAATVMIDAIGVESASQSFADELCKQILVVRSAERLEVHSAKPRFAHYLHESARIRGVADRLIVDVRP